MNPHINWGQMSVVIFFLLWFYCKVTCHSVSNLGHLILKYWTSAKTATEVPMSQTRIKGITNQFHFTRSLCMLFAVYHFKHTRVVYKPALGHDRKRFSKPRLTSFHSSQISSSFLLSFKRYCFSPQPFSLLYIGLGERPRESTKACL